MNWVLDCLAEHNVKCTFFWLGWSAERNKKVIQRCHQEGHEVASHGYAHLLAFKSGHDEFFEDIVHGKKLIEDIIGAQVRGFRAAGFSTKNESTWVFNEIRKAGYTYDSSVFPAHRGHGGMTASPLEPHLINTPSGDLIEFPQSVIKVLGKRLSFFGGGYLRLAPKPVIKWGAKKVQAQGRPLIIYAHTRELDPLHPRLKLPLIRRFKSYINMKSAIPKIEMLCRMGNFMTMGQAMETLFVNNKPVPVEKKLRKLELRTSNFGH